MTYPKAELIAALNRDYPTGTYGYAALLDDLTATNLTYTVNFSTNLITTTAAHGLVTGTRVRSTATVAQPGIAPSGTLNGSTDYFVEVVSATTLKLHATLSSALNFDDPIDFTDAGSGTLQLNEQELNSEDPIEVLVNHELDHPDYARREISLTGSAIAVAEEAQKQSGSWSIAVNSASPAMTFGSVLVLKNGDSATGDTFGTVNNLNTLSSPITIAAGTSKTYVLEFVTLN